MLEHLTFTGLTLELPIEMDIQEIGKCFHLVPSDRLSDEEHRSDGTSDVIHPLQTPLWMNVGTSLFLGRSQGR